MVHKSAKRKRSLRQNPAVEAVDIARIGRLLPYR